MRVCISQNVSLADHLALSTYLANMVKYLSRQNDLELILLTCEGSGHLPEIEGSVEIREIPSDLYSLRGNWKYFRNVLCELADIERTGHIDVIHCLYPLSSLMGASLFKHKHPQTTLVYDIRSPWIDMSVERGSIPSPMGGIYKTAVYGFESILSDNVDAFIFITDGLKKHYEKRLPIAERPLSVIPSGIDLDHFNRRDGSKIRADYGIGEEEIVLGYVGGVSSMRDLGFLIRGFKKASEQRKDLRLMIVGDGDDLENLSRLSREIGCEESTIFTGRVDYSRIPGYISALDIGLCHLPDKLVFRYSFPMKILEYLSCGIRVLASDIQAHSEIVKDIDGIILYKDMQSFVSSLCDLERENHRSIPGLERYSWEQIAASIRELWEEGIGGNGR
ncbi:MAG: glycosyltransferase family 4 protein [Candidatus Thorarchaeota archaeon]